jgi:hypothetical protein
VCMQEAAKKGESIKAAEADGAAEVVAAAEVDAAEKPPAAEEEAAEKPPAAGAEAEDERQKLSLLQRCKRELLVCLAAGPTRQVSFPGYISHL